MINLLPLETKHEYRAGRVNTLLIRYLVSAAITVTLIMVVFGVSFVLNERNRMDYQVLKEDSEIKLGSLTGVRSQVTEFNENIKRAKSIYDSEVVLSDVVVSIAETLPQGAIIGSIALNTQQLSTPLNLVVQVDSFNKGAVLKENFEGSPLFKDVTLANITETTGTGGGKYPFTVNITATLQPKAVKAGVTPAATEAKP